MIVFLAAAHCQESNLVIDFSCQENETRCDERTQFNSGVEEGARLESFKIDILNKGQTPISEVTVLAMMPKGMKYSNSLYYNMGRGILEASVEPPKFNEEQNTFIEWDIGSLQAGEMKSIILKAYLRCSINRTQLEFAAINGASDNYVNTIKNETINLINCINCTTEAVSYSKDPLENINISIKVYEPIVNDTKAVFSIGYPGESARFDIYNITIINNGDVILDNIEVSAILPKGMMLRNIGYSDPLRGRLSIEREPIIFDENLENELRWNIGSLLPEESKSIIMEAYLKYNVDNTSIPLMVVGYSPDLAGNEPIIDFAEKANIARCEFRDKLGRTCEGPFKEDCEKEKKLVCPDDDWQIK